MREILTSLFLCIQMTVLMFMCVAFLTDAIAQHRRTVALAQLPVAHSCLSNPLLGAGDRCNMLFQIRPDGGVRPLHLDVRVVGDEPDHE